MNVNWKKEIKGNVEETIKKIEEVLKTKGFGILTRIDFDKKIDEKLGKKIPQVVILGACNPTIAFEAFKLNKDVTAVMPCNVVVRDIDHGKLSIEMAKPTALMEILGDQELKTLAKEADSILLKALESL